MDRLDCALEAAARGCISGTLAEWPYLDQALRQAGYPLPLTATKQQMQEAAGWIRLGRIRSGA